MERRGGNRSPDKPFLVASRATAKPATTRNGRRSGSPSDAVESGWQAISTGIPGLTVEPTPGHYRVLREGKPLRKQNGMPFMLPFSPDTIRWRRAAIVELRKLGIDL